MVRAAAVSPSVQAQLQQIEETYQRRHTETRSRYQTRLAQRGTRLDCLTALWQAYREETERLREAYRQAWTPWQAVIERAQPRP